VTRSKDRQRYNAMKRINPDYKGFRGFQLEPDRAGQTPLETITCSACGRKRNVPLGIAVEQAESYRCQRCHEEGR